MHNIENMRHILQDLIADFKTPIPWLGWILGTFICAVTGPFGTYEIDTLGFRLLFWGGILGIASIYSLSCVHAVRNIYPDLAYKWAAAVAGFIFIVTYSAFIILLIRQIYPTDILPRSSLIVAIVTCVTISIQIIIHWVGGRSKKPSSFKPIPEPELKLRAHDKNNPFLAKIAPDMGTKLIRLTMRDH